MDNYSLPAIFAMQSTGGNLPDLNMCLIVDSAWHEVGDEDGNTHSTLKFGKDHGSWW